MPWTWSRVTGAVFIFAAVIVFILSPHSRLVIPLNTIGVVFVLVYSRQHGNRAKAPFDHESLRLF